MKKIYSLISAALSFTIFFLTAALLFLNISELHAQSADWAWAKSAGGANYDAGSAVAADANGNVFLTGYFSSSSITFGTTTLTNPNGGYADYFIAKYDADGNVLWAQNAGGTSDEYGYGICADANGNAIVTGCFFSASITFGTTTLNNNGPGYSDIFIVKYDGDGNVLWAKSAGGSISDYAVSIAADASGNSFITGYFGSSTLTFGSTNLTNSGAFDVFVAKYDGNGNPLWASSAGGTGGDNCSSISTDAGGNVFITGAFISPSITFGSITLTNASYADDMFVVKYDGSGNVLWAINGGDAGDDWGYGISTDYNGNVVVTGGFWSATVTFGTTTLTNANAGYSDFFVVKYDGNGNVLWAKGAGNTNRDEGQSIATDASGNIVVAGTMYGSTITFGSTTLTNAGIDDAFFVKYDENGNVLWAENKGGTGYDYGSWISTDANGNLLVTSSFDSPSMTFGSITLTAPGYSGDVYVAKYGNAVGIEETSISSVQVILAPNPAGEYSMISFPFDTGDELQVTDLSGRILFSKIVDAPAPNLKLQTAKFSFGMYLVKISDGKEMAERKLVVQ